MQGWRGWLVNCGHPCQAGPEPWAKAGAQDGLHSPGALAFSDEAWVNWALPKRLEAHPQWLMRVCDCGRQVQRGRGINERERVELAGWGVVLVKVEPDYKPLRGFSQTSTTSPISICVWKHCRKSTTRAFHIARWPWKLFRGIHWDFRDAMSHCRCSSGHSLFRFSRVGDEIRWQLQTSTDDVTLSPIKHTGPSCNNTLLKLMALCARCSCCCYL